MDSQIPVLECCSDKEQVLLVLTMCDEPVTDEEIAEYTTISVDRVHAMLLELVDGPSIRRVGETKWETTDPFRSAVEVIPEWRLDPDDDDSYVKIAV
ncbi:transcription initiation factor IIE subunit beta family protein [Halalkalicoccus jeotgali]|uniref:Uncharacterized protein n=1 Tax=Halalkalicoccus jeotgali (strain DSM 18796 / CECT 7217 / JCM 14584 / KCTC 4019 / B3) TaxID=795797 RepID=D8JAV9_HALJB|nr:hypothetical protein [Halalkalicoccus jeotgali]ADJ14831.1 hypothetical protein HacjB3_07230 [Halalkalicoccus jeotgali B3]ELY39414.1 hypothetical protein C497_05642 [Halalkalicoccus jeotgali B3]